MIQAACAALVGAMTVVGMGAAKAACTTVNGSAPTALSANETVNCEGVGSDNLASTNNGITVNLAPGTHFGTGGPFADLIDLNTVQGSSFNLLSGGAVVLAEDGNTIKLTDGYLSGGQFAIDLDDGNEIWLTGVEAFASNSTILVDTSNFLVISKSQITGAQAGVSMGDNNMVTGDDIIIDVGGIGISAGDNAVVTLTDSDITAGTTGILNGLAGDIQLTNTNIIAGAKGIDVGAGTQLILHDVSIVAAQGGINGTVGFAVITGSSIDGGAQAAIAKNGTAFVIDSTLSGSVGFVTNDVNLPTVLDLTGTAVKGSSNSVEFGNVADTLVLNGGNNLASANGADGGGGTDNIFLRESGSEDEVFANFENLTMQGQDWALSGTSSFTDLAVEQGRLRVNGDITATGSTVVDAAGILGGNGNLTTPLLNNSGGVAPGNSVGTLTITGNYLQNGGFMEVEFDHNGLDLLKVTGTATLTGSPALIIKPIGGAGGAAGTFLVAGGGLTGTFGSVNFLGNGGATVIYENDRAKLFTAQPTGVVAEDAVVLGLGERVLSILGSEQMAHLGNNERKLWGTGLGLTGSRDAESGNAAYDYDTAGALVGSDLYADDGWRLGLGAGYGNTSVDIDDSAGDSNLDGALGLAYGSYERDKWFVLGRVMGGWHEVDSSRTIATVTDIEPPITAPPGTLPTTVTELEHAISNSDAWLLGTGVSFGANLPFEGGWKLSPRVNFDYVRQWHSDVHEAAASGGAIDIDGYSTSAFTASGQFRVGRTLDFAAVSVEPFVQVGVAQRIALGDRETEAEFQDAGADFDVELEHEDRTMGLVDVGAIVDFRNGIAAQLSYGGQFAGDGDQHGVIATIRAAW